MNKKRIALLMVFLLLFSFSFLGCGNKAKSIDTGGEEAVTTKEALTTKEAEVTENTEGTEIAAEKSAIYVSTTGDDGNSGTLEKPFKTIQKGVSMAKPGETVYIRGGTYHEVVSVDNSGTSEKIITISGYPGEKVILDGKNILPTGENPRTQQWKPLLVVKGSHILLKDMTIQNSTSRGIQSGGEYVTLRNLVIDHIFEYGIGIHNQYNIVEDCEVSDTCRVFLIKDGPPAVVIVDTANAIIRRNNIHDNHNQGIGLLRSYYVTIEDNFVKNSGNGSIYCDNAAYPLVQRNIVYYDDDYKKPTAGIMLADEDYTQISKSMLYAPVIINNIVYNASTGFNYWQGERDDSALIDGVFCNNTFININGSGISIDPHKTEDKNTIIANNIVHVKPGANLAKGLSADNPGITVKNNLWSGNPGGRWVDNGDVYGNPELLMKGDPSKPEYYQLSDLSPCIDMGIDISDIIEDFFGNKRSEKLDIGACEFSGVASLPGALPSPASDLKDVEETDSFFDAVNILLENNIISPYSDNTFRPQEPVTADDFIRMTVEALRVSCDIQGKSSATEDHISKAKQLRIIMGNEFTDYSIPITRGEIAPILAKTSIVRGEGNPLNMTELKQNIKDYSNMKSAWATFALQLYSKGIIDLDSSGEYNDALIVTRAEAAKIIARFFEPALRLKPGAIR